MDKKQILAKNDLRRIINKRLNIIIGVGLQTLEDNLLPDDRDKYEKIRYSLMKVVNDISRKIEVDLESYVVDRNRFVYNLPYTGPQ